jgi:dTDP-4-amino-4,6-dideoxygalactose transaminase
MLIVLLTSWIGENEWSLRMIRYSLPHLVGDELSYIQDAIKKGRLSGDGEYTRKCSELLKGYLGNRSEVLLTHSCTAALEMTALLLDIQPGDEVIMPSYTFASTANAFVLRGAIPVFVDIRPDTLNIDETLIESAITAHTKAIVVVHYAGVPCEMDVIMGIAKKRGLLVIEDAAQALGSSFKGRKLGTIGHLATFSFHETKNLISGEGGALIINDLSFLERAEIIREKGTNRTRFFRGEVDKYSWVDVGSSYLPSDLISAFLYAQLRHIDQINELRMNIWRNYQMQLSGLEQGGYILLPAIPAAGLLHNAHIFYFLVQSQTEQFNLLASLKKGGINAVSHYVPLHSSVAGLKFGRIGSSMHVTDNAVNRLVRLPLYPDLSSHEFQEICFKVKRFFESGRLMLD